MKKYRHPDCLWLLAVELVFMLFDDVSIQKGGSPVFEEITFAVSWLFSYISVRIIIISLQ